VLLDFGRPIDVSVEEVVVAVHIQSCLFKRIQVAWILAAAVVVWIARAQADVLPPDANAGNDNAHQLDGLPSVDPNNLSAQDPSSSNVSPPPAVDLGHISFGQLGQDGGNTNLQLPSQSSSSDLGSFSNPAVNDAISGIKPPSESADNSGGGNSSTSEQSVDLAAGNAATATPDANAITPSEVNPDVSTAGDYDSSHGPGIFAVGIVGLGGGIYFFVRHRQKKKLRSRPG
jgi:hypothetical protein